MILYNRITFNYSFRLAGNFSDRLRNRRYMDKIVYKQNIYYCMVLNLIVLSQNYLNDSNYLDNDLATVCSDVILGKNNSNKDSLSAYIYIYNI